MPMPFTTFGGLTLLEMGECRKYQGRWSDSFLLFYGKDAKGKHYLVSCSLCDHGSCFYAYPYEEKDAPKMKNKGWYIKWLGEFLKNVPKEQRAAYEFILNQKDYDQIAKTLGYSTSRIEKCSQCGKDSATDLWFVAGGFCCSSCMEKQKDEYTFLY